MISKIIIEAIEQKKYDDSFENSCCLCGIKKSFKYENRKKILSASFTDYNLMKDRDSQFICGYCEKLLSDNYMDSPKGKKCGVRLYSFLVENGKFKIVDKSEREKYLFEYQFRIPYILCLSNSGQKHISWKSQQGFSNDIIIINTEEGIIRFERKKYFDIYSIVKKLYENKISKDELKGCNLNPKKIKKLIDDKITDFNELFNLKRFKNDINYNLVVDYLYKIKEVNKND